MKKCEAPQGGAEQIHQSPQEGATPALETRHGFRKNFPSFPEQPIRLAEEDAGVEPVLPLWLTLIKNPHHWTELRADKTMGGFQVGGGLVAQAALLADHGAQREAHGVASLVLAFALEGFPDPFEGGIMATEAESQ